MACALLRTADVGINKWVTVMVMTAVGVVEAEAGTSDPEPGVRKIDVLRTAAASALTRGDFAQARVLYENVSTLDRLDARSVREAGRAAGALGDFAYAAEALGRADALARHAPDPELHYLRGEALFALGDRKAARREHDLVERELASMPPTRQSQLWLARVYARRGDVARADALYRALTPAADRPIDTEVSIHRAEAHILNRDWSGAEAILTELLARAPDHQRAQDMLAATLEASGRIDDELRLRTRIASHATTSRQLLDYGRALERSGDFSGALRAYRRARSLAGGPDDPELAIALRRMTQRTSLEVAAAVVGRSDPSSTSLGEQVGLAVPFGTAHHYALGARHERMTAGATSRDGSAGELWTAIATHHRVADTVIGGKLGYLDLPGSGSMNSRLSLSGFASARAALTGRLKVALDGEVNAQWRETPLTLLEGGHVTGATANVYGIAVHDRLIVNAGAQPRRLTLAGPAGSRDPTTSQLLTWAGLDVIAWTNFAHALEGGILDDNMLWPTQLVDSIVVSYRHYELWSDTEPAFMERISLAPRTSIDEASLVARTVMLRSRIGLELRGAIGWDRSRGVATSRGGASLLMTPTRSSQIALTVDVSAESPNGFHGQVRTGWVSYHADL